MNPSTVQSTVNNHSDSVQSKGNGQIKKPIIRQKKTPKPKKDVASKSDTPLTKPRPKRACTIESDRKKKLCVLGKHIEGKDGSWKTIINTISSPMLQCPICGLFFISPESRKKHEVAEHKSLFDSIYPVNKLFKMVPDKNFPSRMLAQFNYLELGQKKNIQINKGVVQELAKRTHALKALAAIRDEDDDVFKCNYCQYESKVRFVLWAHMYSNHLYLKVDAEQKNTCSYCFLCNRTLTKRTTMLKHLDACIEKQSEELPITNIPCRQFKCQRCNEVLDSLKELEKHTWGHAKR